MLVQGQAAGQNSAGCRILQLHTHSPESFRFRRVCARSAKAREFAGRQEWCRHQEEGGKVSHSSHVSGSLRFTRRPQDLQRSPVWGPEAGGAIPGHRHKGPRRVEAAHQAPHVQFVAQERAAQPVFGGAARHGQRGSGTRLPGTARDSSTGPSRRAPGCGQRSCCR